MNSMRAVHEEAMDFAEEALLARKQGRGKQSHEYFLRAFGLEKQAAEQAVRENSPEPTRSVLLRSAGTLALDCGHYEEAERLASLGLAGDPPPDVEEELRDLLERIRTEHAAKECGTTPAGSPTPMKPPRKPSVAKSSKRPISR